MLVRASDRKDKRKKYLHQAVLPDVFRNKQMTEKYGL